MENKKFRLIDASDEENKKFAEAFSALLKTFPDLQITTNIVKKMITMKMEDGSMQQLFMDSPTLLIQKKVEIVEGAVESTNPEVNPTLAK